MSLDELYNCLVDICDVTYSTSDPKNHYLVFKNGTPTRSSFHVMYKDDLYYFVGYVRK